MIAKLLHGLGLVPHGKRTVKPIPANVLALVPKPVDNNRVVKKHGADSLKDTVPLIRDLSTRQMWQGAKLAKFLKRSDLIGTLEADWNFIFDHIQYVKDPEGHETVRSLRRLVHDRKGDCDCFTNALSNLLKNQGIPHKYRVGYYNNQSYPSHIYIVVPKPGGGHYTLDPVVHSFNTEAPNTGYKDFSAMKLSSLDGFGACDDAQDNKPYVEKMKLFVDNQTIIDRGYIPVQQFLESEKIPYQQVVDDKQNTFFQVDTPGGPVRVPTIITRAQADKLKELMGTVGDVAKETAQKLNSKFGWWWLVFAGLSLAFLLSGGKKSKPVQGLAGFAAQPQKRVKRKPYKTKSKQKALPSFSV